MNRRTQRKFSGMAARGWWTAGQAHERALGVEHVVPERAALFETVPGVQPVRRGEELT